MRMGIRRYPRTSGDILGYPSPRMTFFILGYPKISSGILYTWTGSSGETVRTCMYYFVSVRTSTWQYTNLTSVHGSTYRYVRARIYERTCGLLTHPGSVLRVHCDNCAHLLCNGYDMMMSNFQKSKVFQSFFISLSLHPAAPRRATKLLTPTP
jgi:hypothetical protein